MESVRSEPPDLPIFALAPVAGAHHAWVGMLLESERGCTAEHLRRLFEDCGLSGALGALPCIVDCAGVAPEAVAGLAPESAMALCRDGGGEATKALRERGFGVFWQAAPDRPIPAGIDALAWEAAQPLPAATAAVMRRLPGPHLALAVDDSDRFERSLAGGFAWLAGDYPLHFASLNFSRGHGPVYAVLMRLLGLVVHDAETRAIEAVLKQDTQLSFHLLRLVNSAAFARPTPITSFNQAITVLGRRQLQRWLQLLLYANPKGSGPSALLPRAAYRAHFMESLCRRAGGNAEAQDHAFMTGIFSLLDAVFGLPLAELVAPLNLPAPVAAALLQRAGAFGNLLDLVVRAQPAADAAPVRERLRSAGIDSDGYARAMVEACHWATRLDQG